MLVRGKTPCVSPHGCFGDIERFAPQLGRPARSFDSFCVAPCFSLTAEILTCGPRTKHNRSLLLPPSLAATGGHFCRHEILSPGARERVHSTRLGRVLQIRVLHDHDVLFGIQLLDIRICRSRYTSHPFRIEEIPAMSSPSRSPSLRVNGRGVFPSFIHWTLLAGCMH